MCARSRYQPVELYDTALMRSSSVGVIGARAGRVRHARLLFSLAQSCGMSTPLSCNGARRAAPSFAAELAKRPIQQTRDMVAAAQWLQQLSELSPKQLAPCLRVSVASPTPRSQWALQPCVRVKLPTDATNVPGVDVADLLLSILQLLELDAGKFTLSTQVLLLALVSLESSHGETALLVMPSLRARGDFLALAVSACYHWIQTDEQPLMAIAILSGFASPSTSADLPASRATCALVRARPDFVATVHASLKHAKDPRSGLILSRFWDALLGTPPQSDDDGARLRVAIDSLAISPDLFGSINLLLGGLVARASEPSAASRYGAYAPLLRIIASLFTSSNLVAALTDEKVGLVGHNKQLLDIIMNLAVDALGGANHGSFDESHRVDGIGSPHDISQCTSVHDLLAAICLEVIANAVAHRQVLRLFLAAPLEQSANADATDEQYSHGLRNLITATICRYSGHEQAITPHPRLLDAFRTLYRALQLHGPHALLRTLRALAPDESAARRVNEYLNHLNEGPNVADGVACLPRAAVKHANDPHLISSYPVLPSSQPFVHISSTVFASNLVNAAVDNRDTSTDGRGVLSLPEAHTSLKMALASVEEGRGGICLPLGVADGDRPLVTCAPIAANQLVAEYCGELIDNADAVVADFAKYMTIWPSQLYLLRVGNSSLALDISRIASFARLAEHSAHQPTCTLHACRTPAAGGGWRPRVCVLAKRPLEPGDVISIDYTQHTVGGHENHLQADWIMRMRRAPPPVTSSCVNPVDERASTATRAPTLAVRVRPGAPAPVLATMPTTGAAQAPKTNETQQRNAIAALKRLRREPVDFPERQRLVAPPEAEVTWASTSMESLDVSAQPPTVLPPNLVVVTPESTTSNVIIATEAAVDDGESDVVTFSTELVRMGSAPQA